MKTVAGHLTQDEIDAKLGALRAAQEPTPRRTLDEIAALFTHPVDDALEQVLAIRLENREAAKRDRSLQVK